MLGFIPKQKKFYLSKVSLVCILNKRILNLFLWTILVVLLATLSIYLDNKNTISKYEDIPIFKDFSSKINDVSKIKIQTSSNELILEKQNNLWVIKDNSMLPVYQERIKQFLITVNNMRFYEKKSNKVEDLKIAYIGGGSRGWAWTLMNDLAKADDLSGTVRLYDIDFEAAKHNEEI